MHKNNRIKIGGQALEKCLNSKAWECHERRCKEYLELPAQVQGTLEFHEPRRKFNFTFECSQASENSKFWDMAILFRSASTHYCISIK